MKELLTVMEFDDNFDNVINIQSQDITTLPPEEREKILTSPEPESTLPMKEIYDKWSHRPLQTKYFPDGTKRAQILITYTDPETQEKLWMRPNNSAIVAYRPPKNDMQNPACWKSRQLHKREDGYTFAPPITEEEVQQHTIPIEQPQPIQTNWIEPQVMQQMVPTQSYLIPAVIADDEPVSDPSTMDFSQLARIPTEDEASKWRKAILTVLQRDGYNLPTDDVPIEEPATPAYKIKHPNLIYCGVPTEEDNTEPVIEVNPEEYIGFNTDTLVIKADELPSTVPTIETNWTSQFDIGKPTIIHYHEPNISKQIITEEEQLRDWHYFKKEQGAGISYEQLTPSVSRHPNAKVPAQQQSTQQNTTIQQQNTDTIQTFVPFMFLPISLAKEYTPPKQVGLGYKSNITRAKEDLEKKKVLYGKRRDALLAALREVGLYGRVVGTRGVSLLGMNGKNIQCWNTMDKYIEAETDEEIAAWARDCAAKAKEKCIANGTLELNQEAGMKQEAEGNAQQVTTLPPPPIIPTRKDDFEDPNEASTLSNSQIVTVEEMSQGRTIYSREDHQIDERDMYTRFTPTALSSYRQRLKDWSGGLENNWEEDQSVIAWDSKEIELGVGYGVYIKQGDKMICNTQRRVTKTKEATTKRVSTPEHPIFTIMQGDVVIYSSEGDKDELNRQIQEQKEREQAPIKERQNKLDELYTLANQVIEYLERPKREIPWFTKTSGWQKVVDDLALQLQVYDKATAMVLIESLQDPNVTPAYFADRIYPTCQLILEDYKKREEERGGEISYKAGFRYRQVPHKVKFHEKDGSIIEAWVPKSNPERELKKKFEKGKFGKRFPFDLGREPDVEEWAAFYQRAEAELEIEIVAIKAKDILLQAEVDNILDEEYAFWESLKRDRQNKLRIWKQNKNQKSVYRSANYASMTNEEFDKWWYQEDPTLDPNYKETKEEDDERYIRERQEERDRAIARREAAIDNAIYYDDPRYIAACQQWFNNYCEDMANWDEGLMAKCTTLSDIFNVAEYLHNREELRRVENKIAQFNFEQNIFDPSGVMALYSTVSTKIYLDHDREKVSQEIINTRETAMKEDPEWNNEKDIFENLMRRENFENDTDLSAILTPAYLGTLVDSTSNAISPEEAEAILMKEEGVVH